MYGFSFKLVFQLSENMRSYWHGIRKKRAVLEFRHMVRPEHMSTIFRLARLLMLLEMDFTDLIVSLRKTLVRTHDYFYRL